ncbi:metallophosphoesterase [Haloplanus rallus]|jgi:putative phosphoesterase|uniref:Metallophosphoesterase n=1 Tax=Haloplanus rallus TaxID=1816183 RepID=A0A6B9FB02_9EURY|nr:metallophosphoesterase family protein [Haloplanus rallus]QGX95551.1 metallophosphoesterase [Haloplanus rallus]
MRLGVVSDIHGNRIALEAVLDDMPSVDGLVCAGDVVGYNPWPADCVATVRERGVPTVMGNHDRAVARDTAFRFNAMAKAGVDHARAALDDDALSWLADLPPERVVADGRVKLVHGHPEDPDRYTYPKEFSPRMLGDEDLLVTGHTHVQGHRVFADGVVMNPGSVGQPRDGDRRAGYAVVELTDGAGGGAVAVEERRVEYDVDAVVDAVREAGLPERIGTRLYEGR